MGINTLTVTYFLAIDRAPFLEALFPTFFHYGLAAVAVAIPVLILSGYIHFKIIPGFKSEVEINMESNPYFYKLPPGYWLHVVMPFFKLQTELLVKLSSSEKLTEEELSKMKKLQNDMDTLIKGGYVGDPKRLKKLRSVEG